ncbi:hypothetical protein [Nocardia gipuzkoensis]
MSIPAKQLDDLRRQLTNHHKRIAVLHRVIDRLTKEIRLHQRILELAENPVLVELLTELAHDPNAADGATTSEIRAFCANRGLAIPDKVEIAVESDIARVTVYARYVDDLYPVVLSWDRDTGFDGRIVGRPWPGERFVYRPISQEGEPRPGESGGPSG